MVSNVYIYDIEVTKYDWLVVMLNTTTHVYSTFHNDFESLKWFIDEFKPVCGGFYNKHYDNYIIKGILAGMTNGQIKRINDMIVVERINPWDIEYLKGLPKPFESFDLLDDAQDGTSLKSFEAHMGMDITETTVSFDIEHQWSDQELDEMIYYCKFDVKATYELYKLRMNYLDNKIKVGEMAGIDPLTSIYLTNAKLTALFLKAKMPKEERTDARQYVYPSNLLRQYVPQEVFDYFNRMYDMSIPDEELYKAKLPIKIGNSVGNIGYGGIHTAIPNYCLQATVYRLIINLDVGSYYPNLMRVFNYMSRNIPDPQIYFDMLAQRMKAKAEKNSEVANALKLVANTTYGATLDKYNNLYDKLMGVSVCITGQLFLCELAHHLMADIPSVDVIQTNTDGIMISVDATDYDKVMNIAQEWQERTGFTLEEDKISAIYEKDVNNYIEVQTDGSYKLKGGYLVRGIAKAGAFKINNNATIIADAIVDYFVKGVDVEYTINSCTDISKFQLIAKAGSKYSRCYQLIDGEEVGVQKCNRVYASKIYEHGTLYKVHNDGHVAKVESLPKHCIIDNRNELSIDVVDKDWYIREAKKKVNEFLGVKPKRNTRRINKLKKGAIDIVNSL